VDAVRVFSDGHEEPFRGLALPAATAAMFRDVVASGASTTRSQVSDEQGYAMTLTAPSILLGEAELRADRGQGPEGAAAPEPARRALTRRPG
jgi:hypothetical protein